MDSFDNIAPDVTFEALTSKHIEEYLKSLVNNSDRLYEPTQLRDDMFGLKFPVNIRDPFAHITTYCLDVFERLEAIGYEYFKPDNLKHTIKLLLERLKPPPLKAAMHERVNVEAGLEKVFDILTLA